MSESLPKNRIWGSIISGSTQLAPKFHGFLGKNFAVDKFRYRSISVVKPFQQSEPINCIDVLPGVCHLANKSMTYSAH